MSVNQPLVSILIPLYNQERYFEKCIRSVCNQTYKNLEIIVVNDGSTDKSPQIARKWAQKDNRIIVVDKQNEGLPMARRDGFLKATGEYVAFVDSDDVMSLTAIETMLSYIQQHDVDIVVCAAKHLLGLLKWGHISGTFPKNQVVKQPELFEKYYLSFFGMSCFHTNMWARLIRKDVIDKALSETELFVTAVRFMGEDLYFNMQLFPYLKSMYMADDVVYYYRYGGAVDHYNPHYHELFTICQKRLELLDHYQYEDGYGPLFGEYVNMLYYYGEQMLQFKKGNKSDIVKFFEHELTTRSFIPRLIEHYNQHATDNEGIRLLVSHDYEGMYYHSAKLMHNRCDHWRYKMKRLLLDYYEKFC